MEAPEFVRFPGDAEFVSFASRTAGIGGKELFRSRRDLRKPLKMLSYDRVMSDAEQTGYRLAAWAHAHPIAAKLIGWGFVLSFGGLIILFTWNRLVEDPIASVLKLLGIVIGGAVILLMRGRGKPNTDATP